MIRARFITRAVDYRPAHWPIKHPYWCTGYGKDNRSEFSTIVAYADDVAEILRNWPEAEAIGSSPASEYLFTSRFRKPDWLVEEKPLC